MVYIKKNCLGQMGSFGPKNGAHAHNSESTQRIFFKKFSRMKGADRYMKTLLVFFGKQNSFGVI